MTASFFYIHPALSRSSLTACLPDTRQHLAAPLHHLPVLGDLRTDANSRGLLTGFPYAGTAVFSLR